MSENMQVQKLEALYEHVKGRPGMLVTLVQQDAARLLDYIAELEGKLKDSGGIAVGDRVEVLDAIPTQWAGYGWVVAGLQGTVDTFNPELRYPYIVSFEGQDTTVLFGRDELRKV